MNCEDKRRQPDGLDLFFTVIFTMAFPAWERYQGHVPSHELQKLEEQGDWPRGVAATVMKRISSDEDLRKQLRMHFDWSTQTWGND